MPNLKRRCQIMFTKIAKKNKIIIFFNFFISGELRPPEPPAWGLRPLVPHQRGYRPPWTPLSTPTYSTSSNFKNFQKLTFPKNPGNPKNKANFVPKLTPYIFLRYIHYCEINFYFSFRRNNYLIIFLPHLHS